MSPTALIHKELSGQIIGAAIEVHRALGPGLLESAYRACLVQELGLLINFNACTLRQGLRRFVL